jgi:hypothetical protein
MQMKTSRMALFIVCSLAVGFFCSAPGHSQSASCYVLAGMEKTFIFVREVDPDGNPLGELGSGWINRGDQMPVTSRSGNIVISYQLSSSDKSFKMDPRQCSNGAVITVP